MCIYIYIERERDIIIILLLLVAKLVVIISPAPRVAHLPSLFRATSCARAELSCGGNGCLAETTTTTINNNKEAGKVEHYERPDPETISFRMLQTYVKHTVPSGGCRVCLWVWVSWIVLESGHTDVAGRGAFAAPWSPAAPRPSRPPPRPRDSEPSKRVISGWVVSGDPSFALRI